MIFWLILIYNIEKGMDNTNKCNFERELQNIINFFELVLLARVLNMIASIYGFIYTCVKKRATKGQRMF